MFVARVLDVQLINESYATACHEIVPNLFLGNAAARHSLPWTRHTASMCEDAPMIITLLGPVEYQHLHRFLGGPGEHYFELNDTEAAGEFPAVLRACVTLLESEHWRRRRPVLVHCYAGVSRSASVVIAYLTKRYAIGAQEAYEMVEDRRPCINPNLYFQRELLAFERELNNNNTS